MRCTLRVFALIEIALVVFTFCASKDVRDGAVWLFLIDVAAIGLITAAALWRLSYDHV